MVNLIYVKGNSMDNLIEVKGNGIVNSIEVKVQSMLIFDRFQGEHNI